MKNIAVHSVPRSGSTWLGNIFDSHPEVIYKYQPLFSYAFKGTLTKESSKEEIDHFFNDIAISNDDFLDQLEAKRKGIVPVFKKITGKAVVYKEVRYHHILRNILLKNRDITVVGLIRNPLSTIHSWLSHPSEFKTDLGWIVEEEWSLAPKKNQGKPEEFFGYQKWKEVAYLFLDLSLQFFDRFYLIRYDHLLFDTKGQIEKLFDFCGLEVSDQTLNFIELSSSIESTDPYSVFRKNQRDDKWSGKLPNYILSYIRKDLENTILEQFIVEY